MKNSLIISDTGPIISLALVDRLNILTTVFEDVIIPEAVWNELTQNKNVPDLYKIKPFFRSRVKSITRTNNLNSAMDLGESEAVILFKEQQADILLIDDKKARDIAEEQGLITKLKPLFVKLLLNKRFYAISLLNAILIKYQETPFTAPSQRT